MVPLGKKNKEANKEDNKVFEFTFILTKWVDDNSSKKLKMFCNKVQCETRTGIPYHSHLFE
jgi:hypothetical protein